MNQRLGKYLIVVIALAWLTAPSLWAQGSTPGVITDDSADCGTAGTCVVHVLNGNSTASVAVVLCGTSEAVCDSFMATLEFEATANNLKWEAAQCTPKPSGASVTSATTTGTWVCNVASMITFRVRASTFTSGPVAVRIRSSTAMASLNSVTSGTVDAATINNIRYANQFAGADAGAKIAAAIADLPSTGGTVDARGLEGAQAISSSITVDKKVHLLLGAATFTSSVAPVFTITSPSTISGGGSWATVFAVSATSGEAVSVDLTGTSQKDVSVLLENFQLDGPNSGTGDGIKLYDAVGWKVRDVVIREFGNDGFAVTADSAQGRNANLGVLDNVSVYDNGRYGFYLTGNNVNVTTFLATDSRSNAEGYHIESAWNVLVGAHASGNDTYAFNVTTIRGHDNSGKVYIEGGEAGSVLIFGASTTRNRIEILDSVTGNPTITDNGSGNSYLRYDGTRYGWVGLPAISLKAGGGGPITINNGESIVPEADQNANLGANAQAWRTIVGIDFTSRRLGTGVGNGQVWGLGVLNSGATDSLSLRQSSTTYTTGGALGWVGNSTPFLYFPSGQNFKVGSGTGTAPAITINGSSHNVTLGGNTAKTLGMDRHLTANTAGNDLTIPAGGATSGATDKAGGALLLQPGLGTGSAVPALTRIQQDALGTAAGTADHTRVDRLITGASKVLTNNTNTALVNATLASNTVVAGKLSYAVEVFNGTDLQVEEGMITYHVTNKGGSAANNTTVKFGNQQAMTSGTLTVTWTITAANPAVLTINANSSLTPSAGYPRVSFSLENLAQQAVAVQ